MMCRVKTIGDNEEIIAPTFTLPDGGTLCRLHR
jgi:hypothetical protein